MALCEMKWQLNFAVKAVFLGFLVIWDTATSNHVLADGPQFAIGDVPAHPGSPSANAPGGAV